MVRAADSTRNPRRKLTPPQCLAHCIEWWPIWDTSILNTKVDGSGTHPTNGTMANQMVGKVGGVSLATSSNASGPLWGASLIGGRGALQFSGNKGFIGPWAKSFGSGATIIVVGQFTALSATFKAILSGGPDLVTSPWLSTNGFYLNMQSPATQLVWSRDQAVFGPAMYCALDGMVTTSPTLITARMRFNPDPVAANLMSGYQCLGDLSANGGYPTSYDAGQDVSGCTIAQFSIGGATTSRACASLNISDVIVCSAPETGKCLEKLRRQYLSWCYPGVF